MTHTIEIRPSGRRIENHPDESLLQSALNAGLAVDYGCSNGNCGKCRARLVSGEIERLAYSDFVFREDEKADGWFLMCCHRAASDVVIDTSLAVGSGDIPLQEIEVKVRRVEPLDDDFTLLHVQTPRTRRLRFLAGQSARLSNGSMSCTLPIASCPCDDRNLHFHVPSDPALCPAAEKLSALRLGQTLELSGPTGDFVLDAESTRPRVMIGDARGVAPLKSIAEHSLALAGEVPVALLVVGSGEAPHYMENLFRSWADALEAFRWAAVPAGSDLAAAVAALFDGGVPDDADFYLAGAAEVVAAARAALEARGVDAARVRALVL